MASSDAFHRPSRHAPALRYLQLLGRAASHVDAHLDSTLDAGILAREAAMSPHHFHRVFHAHFGLTVGSYITWRRLQRACLLLTQSSRSVLEIALSVGYGSAQALAKAMQRELGLTPTAVRLGQPVRWPEWLERQRMPEMPISPTDGRSMLRPRWHLLPALTVLAATGRGMRHGHMTDAVQQGFGRLIPALQKAALMPSVSRCMSWLIDAPQGPDDPDCSMLTGALFGYDPHTGRGQPEQAVMTLSAGLQWVPLPAGSHAVFMHLGPYTGLADLWTAIYRHWVPMTGYPLRDAPSFDLYLDDPRTTAPEQLRTALYLPVA